MFPTYADTYNIGKLIMCHLMEYSIFSNVFKDVQHVQHETRLQGVFKTCT